jgi:predicted transcriptional regulator
MTAQAVRDRLARNGTDLSYATVANLVRTVHDKGFLAQTNAERPFVYEPTRSYEDVSGRLLGDLIDRVFLGSRAELLLRLVEERRLSAKERDALQEILKEHDA